MKLSVTLSKLRTATGGFVLISIMVGFLCISLVHSVSAHMGMSHVAYTNSLATWSSCCDAGVNDHMELWKSTLTGIPQGFQDLFALFVLAVAATFVFSDFFAPTKLNSNFFFLRYKQYAREHPNIQTFNLFRLAFAQGLLNPKLY